MDILDLLEINRDRLPRETVPTMKYLDGSWAEHGRPMHAAVLADFLDGRIRFCANNGWRYPRVLLLRLKQLQRGEWRPKLGAA